VAATYIAAGKLAIESRTQAAVRDRSHESRGSKRWNLSSGAEGDGSPSDRVIAAIYVTVVGQ